MIKTWKHKGLRRFFETGNTSGIQSKHASRLSEQLFVLNRAKGIEDIRLPGYFLHKLKGNLTNYYAITVSGGWRIIFGFESNNVTLVNYLNYH